MSEYEADMAAGRFLSAKPMPGTRDFQYDLKKPVNGPATVIQPSDWVGRDYDASEDALYARKQWLLTEKIGERPDAKTQTTPYKNLEYMQIINKIREDIRAEQQQVENIELERQHLQNSQLRASQLLINQNCRACQYDNRQGNVSGFMEDDDVGGSNF